MNRTLWKRITCLALCAVLMAGLVPVGAATQEETQEQQEETFGVLHIIGSGTFSYGITWELMNTGTLTISGTGAMRDIGMADAPWREHRDLITRVVIEDGITRIGNYVFTNCTALTDLRLGDTVTSIGSCAFSSCTALEKITIPESVTVLGDSAFLLCTSLKEVFFEGDAPTLGSSAFELCGSPLVIDYYEGSTGFRTDDWQFFEHQPRHWGQWVVDVEPTCTTDGSRHIFCGYCHETFTEVIPAAHRYVGGICSVCGAEESIAEGPVGDNLTWELCSDGTLILSGTGPMASVRENRPWNDYADQILAVRVEEGITSVSVSAFNNIPNLKDVILASTVNAVENSAFAYCDALETVTFLGPAPEQLHKYAFYSSDTEIRYPVQELSWNRAVMDSLSGAELRWIPQGEISELVITAMPEHVTDYVLGDSVDTEGLMVDAVLPSGGIAQLHASSVTASPARVTTLGKSQVEISIPTGVSTSYEIIAHPARETVTLDPAMYPESEHEYGNAIHDVQTITYLGADSLTLTFSEETRINDHESIWYSGDSLTVWAGEESIVLYAPAGSGIELAGLTVTVPGDTARIVLTTDGDYSAYGYSFSSITANMVTHSGQQLDAGEATCTENGHSAGGVLCEFCGEITRCYEFPALGHDWDQGIVSGMVDTYTCGRCHLAEPREITPELYFYNHNVWYEWEVLMLVNRERAALGVQPLTGCKMLQQPAGIRAEELEVLFDPVGHMRPDGTDYFTVLYQLGIPFTGTGENIASGYNDARRVMNSWMGSPGHRENILRPSFTHMGVGFHPGSTEFWEQIFVHHNDSRYTSLTLYFPNGQVFPTGTGIDDMGIYAVLEDTVYGLCFLPIMEEFITGYDPAHSGSQTVTLDVLGFQQTFTLRREEEETHVPGDITGDGVVNNKDLTRLFRYLSGFEVEVNEAALDITADGSVNNKDLTRLFRYLSGFAVEIH